MAARSLDEKFSASYEAARRSLFAAGIVHARLMQELRSLESFVVAMSPHAFLSAALFLSATPASAEDQCTLGTLQGQYAFTGRGFIEALEPGVQRMHYGFFVFDGKGKLTGKQSSSRGGKIGREELEGTYTLGADCSGTMTFSFAGKPHSETHWDVYVGNGGNKGNMIRMDEGNMAVRSFEK